MQKKMDLMQFIQDFFESGSHQGEFCQMVDDEDTTAEKLVKAVQDWGYRDVTKTDCAMVLLFARGAGLSTTGRHRITAAIPLEFAAINEGARRLQKAYRDAILCCGCGFTSNRLA